MNELRAARRRGGTANDKTRISNDPHHASIHTRVGYSKIVNRQSEIVN
jgi:hypothetical protein